MRPPDSRCRSTSSAGAPAKSRSTIQVKCLLFAQLILEPDSRCDGRSCCTPASVCICSQTTQTKEVHVSFQLPINNQGCARPESLCCSRRAGCRPVMLSIQQPTIILGQANSYGAHQWIVSTSVVDARPDTRCCETSASKKYQGHSQTKLQKMKNPSQTTQRRQSPTPT